MTVKLPSAHTTGEAIAYRNGYRAGLAAGRKKVAEEIVKRIAAELNRIRKKSPPVSSQRG